MAGAGGGTRYTQSGTLAQQPSRSSHLLHCMQDNFDCQDKTGILAEASRWAHSCVLPPTGHQGLWLTGPQGKGCNVLMPGQNQVWLAWRFVLQAHTVML